MPNGGSDCCATCWFNAANRGAAGHGKGDPAIEPACEIRQLRIEAQFHTYCANHPMRIRERVTIPIGPVWVDQGRGREISSASPDTPQIRAYLLQRLASIGRASRPEYPIGAPLDAVVIWQAGEFAERGAIAELQRIGRMVESLAPAAAAALAKISAASRPPAPAPTLQERVLGVLFGQAVGDALGLGAEFMSREDVQWHYPAGLTRYEQIFQDGHRRRWKPGAWTDDTEQMTMILDSLLELGRVDPRDIGRRFANWVFHAHGQGVGDTVYSVLKHPSFDADPHAAALAVWERSGRRNAANGGVMRSSVVGLWDFHDAAKVRANAETICKVTHFDPRCVASCVVVSLLVNALAKGRAPDASFLEEMRGIASEYDERAGEPFALAAQRNIRALRLDDEQAAGYTLKALAAGLWALRHAPTFEDGLFRVIAEGGDADSNASVSGALLGARFGLAAIPRHLVEGLAGRRYLERAGAELLRRIGPAP